MKLLAGLARPSLSCGHSVRPRCERLAYAIGDAASCLAWNGVAAFLFASWLEWGLPAAVIGGILFAGQILTVFSDFLVGLLSDRGCRQGIGYRYWIRGSAVPIALALPTLFVVPGFVSGNGRIVLVTICYVIFLIVYSCCSVPYSSLLKTMTDDPAERTSFSSWRMVGAFLGVFVVTTGLPLLIEVTASRIWALGIVSVVLCSGLLVASFGVVERNLSDAAPRSPASSRGETASRIFWRTVFGRSFLRLFLIAVLFCAANGARFGALAIYVVKSSDSLGACAGGFACLTLASALGAGCVSMFARRIGLPRVLVVAATAAAGTSAVFFLLGGPTRFALYLFLVVVEFFSGMMPVVCNVIVSSFADPCGDAAGRVFAIWGMTGKLGQGLASLTISLSLMAWPGQTGASVALSIVPAVFLALIPLLLIGRRPHA